MERMDVQSVGQVGRKGSAQITGCPTKAAEAGSHSSSRALPFAQREYGLCHIQEFTDLPFTSELGIHKFI